MSHQQDQPARGRVPIWSAGGVVARRNGGSDIEVLVCHREREDLWALPKGTPDGDERPAQTALREVGEETGLQVEIVAKAGTISYSFTRNAAANPRYHGLADGDEVVFDKQVHFFLMRPIGGDTSQHDHEFDAVLWMTADEARRKLTHDSESGIVEKALAIFEGRTGDQA